MTENTASAPATTGSRSWFIIFLALVTLTALELYTTGVQAERALRITVLCGLAISKGALVLLFFMHLRDEPRALKWTALIPVVLSAAFVVVLALDTVSRLTRAP
ncbi:MAG TPA: cytochrome C oxidase subunit IV family protein [Polyangia bacterium]|jgi:cytochrome c oxidase subunit 4|nr:cytochrome C oxidase subunit IV family protein [Polyangia bacterium]